MPIKESSMGREMRPFGLPWLDSCFQETLLPSGPWQQVGSKLCDGLAVKISKQLAQPHRRQIIFHLLGADFVEKYFPDEQNTPAIIEPPDMSTGDRQKLEVDAQNWLHNTLHKVSQDQRCFRPHQNIPDGQEMAPEMLAFLQHTEGIMYKGLNRHLYLQQKEFLEQLKSEEWRKYEDKEREKASEQQARMWREAERLRRANSGMRGILKSKAPIPPLTAGSMVSAASSLHPPNTAHLKGQMHGMSTTAPQLWGMESDSLGRSITAILRSDPRRFLQVAAVLHGKQLPGVLRTYIWLDVLLRKDRQRIKEGGVERAVRERFGKAVSRGVGELRIKRATHSPISSLIDNAVIEIYDATPSLRSFSENNLHMKEAARSLNILYVYDRSYEPYLVHWLFPLQLAFQDAMGESDHVYELGMYLDLLNKSNFPTWPEVYAIAERAIQRLAEHDAQLHRHLCHIALVDPHINPKEFLVQVIHQEKSKAEMILAHGSKGKDSESNKLKGSKPQAKSPEVSATLLTDPVVFLRKWVGEGFVGVLDTWAVLWAWDQFFMQKWQPRPLEDLCLSLLELLRPYFLEATNYSHMKQVFLQEPCRIYTKDLQAAWVHVQKGGDIRQIPPLNRQAAKRESDPQPLRVDPSREPAPSPTPSPSPLPPTPTPTPTPTDGLPRAAIKRLRLELAISPQTVKKEKWMENFKVGNLRLTATLYFGSIQLDEQKTKENPASIGTRKDRFGNTVRMVDFLEERFQFEYQDLSQFDLEQDLGGQPVVIVRVDYIENAKLTRALGWARIKLYRHKSEAQQKHTKAQKVDWTLAAGDQLYPLRPGSPPDGAATGRDGDKDGMIAAGSQFGAQIYDPDQDGSQPTVPRTPKSKKAAPVALQASPSPPRPPTPDLHSPFDLYVDRVDYLPENSSIVKVTGKFLNIGDIEAPANILALPDLTASSRSPRFLYKLLVNEAQGKASSEMVVLLRVYTVSRDNHHLVVIGSCLFPVFNENGKLRVGGHAKVLHSGMPSLRQGESGINERSLDDAPRIPGCTLYIRLTAHTQEPVPPPQTEYEAYSFEDDDMNESERRVIESYNTGNSFPDTEEAMVSLLRDQEEADSADNGEEWIRNRLDQNTQLPPEIRSAPNMPLHKVVRFSPSHGVNIKIDKAYGLPDGFYIDCFARVLPEDLGRDEKFVTLKHDFTCPQSAPQWTDEPKTLKPKQNMYGILMLQIFGFSVEYKPTKDHRSPGRVTHKSGLPLSLGDESVLGWAVVPIFDGRFIYGGEHHVAIFKGRPDADLLDDMTQNSAVDVVSKEKWTNVNKFDNAGVVVKVWDGHFDLEHYPGKLERRDDLLEAVGGVEPYREAEKAAPRRSVRLSQIVLDSLDKKARKQGTSGDIYQKELEYFRRLMEDSFYNLMEGGLMDAGYGPL